MTDVTDGTSSTIMVVECAGRPLVYRSRTATTGPDERPGHRLGGQRGAVQPRRGRADGSAEGCGPAGGCTVAMNRRNDNEPYSFHPGGGNFLFADGHVQFVRESVPLATFAALCTRAAGEVATIE